MGYLFSNKNERTTDAHRISGGSQGLYWVKKRQSQKVLHYITLSNILKRTITKKWKLVAAKGWWGWGKEWWFKGVAHLKGFFVSWCIYMTKFYRTIHTRMQVKAGRVRARLQPPRYTVGAGSCPAGVTVTRRGPARTGGEGAWASALLLRLLVSLYLRTKRLTKSKKFENGQKKRDSQRAHSC